MLRQARFRTPAPVTVARRAGFPVAGGLRGVPFFCAPPLRGHAVRPCARAAAVLRKAARGPAQGVPPPLRPALPDFSDYIYFSITKSIMT